MTIRPIKLDKRNFLSCFDLKTEEIIHILELSQSFKKKEFPNASRIAYNSFSLPVGPHIKKKDISYMINSIKNILNTK